MRDTRDSAEYLSISVLNLEIKTVVSGPVACVSDGGMCWFLAIYSVFLTHQQSVKLHLLAHPVQSKDFIYRPISQDKFFFFDKQWQICKAK